MSSVYYMYQLREGGGGEGAEGDTVLRRTMPMKGSNSSNLACSITYGAHEVGSYLLLLTISIEE